MDRWDWYARLRAHGWREGQIWLLDRVKLRYLRDGEAHEVAQHRLEFARYCFETGKLTDGQMEGSALRIGQVVAMVTSEEAAQRKPEYSGGGG